MSTDVAANILFGDLRCSYNRQQARVGELRVAAEQLEARFLVSVRNCATRSSKSISNDERKRHDDLRQTLNRTRLQLADEVKLLQWLRRRHNMAVINSKARNCYLVF